MSITPYDLTPARRHRVQAIPSPCGVTLPGRAAAAALRRHAASPRSIAPEVGKALGIQLRIAHRMLHVLVLQIVRNRPRILPGIGQRIAGGMPQHMRMDGAREPGRPARASILRTLPSVMGPRARSQTHTDFADAPAARGAGRAVPCRAADGSTA